MKIRASEYKILDKFYSEYFKLRDFVDGKKPDIERFIKNIGRQHSKRRLRLILSLYTFNFWCLSYFIKKPSNEIIESKFEHYLV